MMKLQKALLGGIAKISSSVAESAAPLDWDGSWVWAYHPPMPESMRAEQEIDKVSGGETEN